jgi:hypothetical protein
MEENELLLIKKDEVIKTLHLENNQKYEEIEKLVKNIKLSTEEYELKIIKIEELINNLNNENK